MVMLEIVLARHGRPLQAPLDVTLRPPPSLIALTASARRVVTSTAGDERSAVRGGRGALAVRRARLAANGMNELV